EALLPGGLDGLTQWIQLIAFVYPAPKREIDDANPIFALQVDSLLNGSDHSAVGSLAVLVEDAQIDQVCVGSNSFEHARVNPRVTRILPASCDPPSDVLAVSVTVIRAPADEILTVNDTEFPSATGAVQVGTAGDIGSDPAVNHGNAYSRAVPARLPGDVCVHHRCGVIEQAVQSPVGRDVSHIRVVRKGIQGFNRH